MDTKIPTRFGFTGQPSFDVVVPAVSDQELERLHLAASREVDLQYFVQGACRTEVRARYLLLNDELHRRANRYGPGTAPGLGARR